jgi:ion channel
MTPVTLLRIFSIGNAKELFSESGGHVFMDLYVLLSGAILTLVLFVPGHFGSFGIIAAVYRIADIISYRLYFMLVKSQVKPWSINLLRRSLLIVVVNFCETVIGYAVLYLTIGNIVGTAETTKHALTPIDALYYSTVTATTLGYGDYIPVGSLSQLLVMAQLIGSVLFLIFLIPALISLFATEKT